MASWRCDIYKTQTNVKSDFEMSKFQAKRLLRTFQGWENVSEPEKSQKTKGEPVNSCDK